MLYIAFIYIMAESGKIVVLCKGLSEKDDTQDMYIKSLESVGYTCEYLQTLRFQFINILELRTCLLTPDKYTGNILLLCKYCNCYVFYICVM